MEEIVAVKYNGGRRLQNQQPMELKKKTLFPKKCDTKTQHSRFKKKKSWSYKHVKAT